jgi:hypothetical protein
MTSKLCNLQRPLNPQGPLGCVLQLQLLLSQTCGGLQSSVLDHQCDKAIVYMLTQ